MVMDQGATALPKNLSSLAGSRPVQLDIFERIIRFDKAKIYTQSLELWDSAPKYVLGPIVGTDGKVIRNPANAITLPSQKRVFFCRVDSTDIPVTIEIKPGRIRDRTGKERDFFPGLREHLIEHAARKIAISGHRVEEAHAPGLASLFGVRVGVQELRRELATLNHMFSWTEVRDAIALANASSLSIRIGDGRPLLAPIFPVVMLPTEPRSTALIVFHPLVAHGIINYSFRQISYEVSMRLTSAMARYLHRRLSHRYVQASLVAAPYGIKASTIIRDSGIFVTAGRLRDQLAAVDDAVWELREAGVLAPLSPEAKRAAGIRQGIPILERRRWVDTRFNLYPSLAFVDEMKAANFAEKGR